MPDFTKEEIQVSKQLQSRIISAIKRNGGEVGFDEFLQIVLYEPGLGYYASGSYKLGVGGDFTTAPEISSLYSRTLATQCQEILEDLENASILELGAGTGVMARDILLSLFENESIPEQYYILEPSPDLKQRQQQTFETVSPELRDKVIWLDKEPDESFTGIILANEVVDALPFKRVLWENDRCYELTVTYDGGQLQWKKSNDTYSFGYISERFQALSLGDGYITEVHNYLSPWLNSLAAWLRQGVILIADYGSVDGDHFQVENSHGSMRCYYRHGLHTDPFKNLGLQDITCDVNFSELACFANASGLNMAAYTTQANFLLSCGIEQVFAQQQAGMEMDNKSKEHYSLVQEFKTLMMADEMGERFKFMALTKAYDKLLQGFSFKDLSYQL